MRRTHPIVSWYLFFLLTVSIGLSSCQPSTSIVEEPMADIEAIENNLKLPIVFEGEEQKKLHIFERMDHYNVPGVSIAVIQDGKLAWARGYGYANTQTMDTIDVHTVFQAGSISKPIAALAALKLADQGKIDLDENVNTYLKDWKVPDNQFTKTEKVTLRRLLTHTAGLTVHGFPGYEHDETIPSVIEVLDGKGNTGAIRVDTFPGSIWRYSGGGYTIMQKMVEDVSGEDFATFVSKEVLKPLGMSHSTYVQPLPESFHDNASAAFDGAEGKMAEGLWNNYPEKAAAGLWTTPSDLVKYCLDVQSAMADNSSKVLTNEMIRQMLRKDQNGWGLGPSLQYEGDSLTFGHGGKNRGFSNLMTAFAHKGEGAIIMTNADMGTSLMREIMAGISDHYGWGWYKSKAEKKVPMGVDQMKSFEGTYVFPFDGEDYPITLKVKDGYLEVYDTPLEAYYSFYPTSDVNFVCPDRGDKITFVKNEAGAVTALDYLDNGTTRFVKRE